MTAIDDCQMYQIELPTSVLSAGSNFDHLNNSSGMVYFNNFANDKCKILWSLTIEIRKTCDSALDGNGQLFLCLQDICQENFSGKSSLHRHVTSIHE